MCNAYDAQQLDNDVSGELEEDEFSSNSEGDLEQQEEKDAVEDSIAIGHDSKAALTTTARVSESLGGMCQQEADRRAWCRFGYFCRSLRDHERCRFQHSKEQIEYFERNVVCEPRKLKPCQREFDSRSPCRHIDNPKDCNFLHTGEPPLCKWCRKQHKPDCYTYSNGI